MAKQATFAQHSLLSSRHASYRLGLIDPRSLAPMLIDPLDVPCFKLLVPGQEVFASLLIDPGFQDGAIWGYYDPEMCETPAQVANWVWHELRSGLYDAPDDRAWLVGFLLGSLSCLAETNRLIALVGIAHLSFVLSLVPPLLQPRLSRTLCKVGALHDTIVRAYRALVRDHKAQGLDFAAASHAALTGLSHLHAPYADGSCSNALPVEESEVA